MIHPAQAKMATGRAGRMILELSIFADQALLNLFLPYFSQETSDKEQQYVKFREVILAFVNAVRLYLQPKQFHNG